MADHIETIYCCDEDGDVLWTELKTTPDIPIYTPVPSGNHYIHPFVDYCSAHPDDTSSELYLQLLNSLFVGKE
jgi:hypothetical protein